MYHQECWTRWQIISVLLDPLAADCKNWLDTLLSLPVAPEYLMVFKLKEFHYGVSGFLFLDSKSPVTARYPRLGHSLLASFSITLHLRVFLADKTRMCATLF